MNWFAESSPHLLTHTLIALCLIVAAFLTVPQLWGSTRLTRLHDAPRSGVQPSDAPSNFGSPGDLSTPMLMELISATLRAGMPLAKGAELVAQCSSGAKSDTLSRLSVALEVGSDWELAWRDAPASLRPLQRTLALGQESGAELSQLLMSAAEDLRSRAKRQSEMDVAKLSVYLMLPSGLLSLPSFVCLGIAPVIISLTGQGML